MKLKAKWITGGGFTLAILAWVIWFQMQPPPKPCQPKAPQCALDEICSSTDLGQWRCVPLPDTYPNEIPLPFEPKHPVQCLQGNAVPDRSHFHDNILFAVDLHSPAKSEAGKILAVQDGIAEVFDSCLFRYHGGDARNDEDCGSGYGNHVRLAHAGGYLSIYAHLSHVLVRQGESVKKGTPVGIEGASGRAGTRHLHFGIHRPAGLKEVLKNPGWTGLSVPFRMRLRYGDRDHPESIPSRHLRCGEPRNAPLLYAEER
jgi:hypothetical protein